MTESQETNPYSPPSSKKENKRTGKGSPKKAVIVACSVDILGTLIMSVIIGFTYGFILALQGIPQQEIATSYYTQSMLSPVKLLSLALGLSITIYAGYLCAKIGNSKNYNLITIYLIIVVAIMSLLSALGGEDLSSLNNIVFTTISILAGYFGGWLYIRNNL